MKKQKQQFVGNLKNGDVVNDSFILLEKAISRTREGKPFLNAQAADKTGRIKLVMWDMDESGLQGISSGDPVQLEGRVKEYQEKPQLVVASIHRLERRDIEASDYLEALPSQQSDDIFKTLSHVANSLTSPWLKQLFDVFWSDADFIEKFKKAPAAMRIHHAVMGGLMKHTLSVAKLADEIVTHYGKKGGIDRDLLIAGAILHDIGKIHELSYDVTIDYSDEGKLLGHIVIGLRMFDEKVKQVEGFPEDQANLLRHMIASHHGTREFGSPELPKTLEAVLLNCIDEIDARVDGIRDFIALQDGAEAWSAYYNPMERRFYLGKRKPENG